MRRNSNQAAQRTRLVAAQLRFHCWPTEPRRWPCRSIESQFYTVKAYDAATKLSAAATVNGLPGSPTGLAALVTNSLVRLTWSAGIGATGYNVKRSAASGGPYSVAGTTATTTYDDAAVTVGLTYYYVVTATNSAGQSGVPAEVEGNVVAVPDVTVSPASRTNIVGTTAMFNVAATGGFLSYQWRKGTQDLVNGGNISGVTTPNLTLTRTRFYRVRVE